MADIFQGSGVSHPTDERNDIGAGLHKKLITAVVLGQTTA
jgi:hypothetical protein